MAQIRDESKSTSSSSCLPWTSSEVEGTASVAFATAAAMSTAPHTSSVFHPIIVCFVFLLPPCFGSGRRPCQQEKLRGMPSSTPVSETYQTVTLGEFAGA